MHNAGVKQTDQPIGLQKRGDVNGKHGFQTPLSSSSSTIPSYQYTVRLAFMTAGWFSLSLGMIGIFLPVLPTTPFVILAGLCFSKGSPRLHQWLLSQPGWGKLIVDWEQYGCISQKAKRTATLLIILLFSFTLTYVAVPWWLKGFIVLIGGSVLLFIWTRPNPPSAC